MDRFSFFLPLVIDEDIFNLLLVALLVEAFIFPIVETVNADRSSKALADEVFAAINNDRLATYGEVNVDEDIDDK